MSFDAQIHLPLPVCLLGSLLALSACEARVETEEPVEITTTDPLLAKTLSDPLMTDPDLSHRNEANAAVSVRYDHPLPPLFATDELASRAENAARVELLNDGPLSDLPTPISDADAVSLAGANDARDIVSRLGGPAGCAARLSSGLEWAADMPGPSAIMPHGMVQQAAGVQGGGCSMRVVRYLTPAGQNDVLEYHFTKADRARLRPIYNQKPESSIVGDSRSEHIVINTRKGPGGLAAVDLVYWRK